ncbi:MAG: rplS [Bacteriovoracaceae bacterium]|nr:rplS [Bacteriovoracaceae bacterium]
MKRRLDPTALLNKANKKLHPKEFKFPEFSVGDTIKVHVKVAEGEKVRVQIFEGLVIAKRNGSLGGRFVVRKISYGIGVERIFQSNSPVIEKITIVAKGNVRRSKLYYLRELSGRSARIKSDQVFGSETEAPPTSDVSDAAETATAKALQA